MLRWSRRRRMVLVLVGLVLAAWLGLRAYRAAVRPGSIGLSDYPEAGDPKKPIDPTVIRGYNEYCGLLPSDSVLAMEPPIRGPCRRLDSRLMLLADGRATLCAQDVTGELAIGSWVSQSLDDLWGGERVRSARRAHSRLKFDDYPLCKRCREWFRP